MIVQAIVTKFLGPTNFRGSRIKASAAAGSITVSSDHSLGIEANHAVAAETLAAKLGWIGRWFQGGMPGDSGYCFVCTANKYHAADPAFVVEPKKVAA